MEKVGLGKLSGIGGGGGVCRGVEIMVEGGAWMVREMEIMRWTHSKDMPSSWFL